MIWRTYVLVCKWNTESWYNMNVDRSIIEEQIDEDTCLARWTYKRYETGDVLIKQEVLQGDGTWKILKLK